jgi:hypothetical protein
MAGGYMILGRTGLPLVALLVPVAMGVAGVWVIVGLNLHGRPPRTPWIVLGAMTITYCGLVLWALPAVEQQKVVPDVARWVARRAAGNDRVASYRLNRWSTSFRFYVGRHVSIIEIEKKDEARALLTGPEPFYCAMIGTAYDEFVAQGVPLRVVYEREGMWVTSGRALWGRPVPPTRFVVVTNVQQ